MVVVEGWDMLTSEKEKKKLATVYFDNSEIWLLPPFEADPALRGGLTSGTTQFALNHRRRNSNDTHVYNSNN